VIANSVVKKLIKKKASLSVAESITGGGLSAAITEVAGSSKVFLGGVIAYAEEIKINELN
jgi:PncC family amidohydrolase